ncbi:MAG: hydrogenase maturation protease [bacterium]
MKKEDQILVLGIGNEIRGDDGVGIHLARRLKEILPSRYEIKELTTAGLDLMWAISGYGEVFLIDAINTPGGVPGEVYHLELEDSRYSSNVSSFHALNLAQVLELGRKLIGDRMPDKIKLLVVEAPRVNEFSQNLSPEIEEQFDDIVEDLRTEIETEN